MALTGNNITHNTATNYGGAIYNYQSNMNLTGNNITRNNANSGGAIYNTYRSNMALTENNITRNNANSRGAIYNDQSNMNLTGNNITHNTVNQNGGAIYNNNYANMTLTENNITKNTAINNGAIYNNKAIINKIENNEFSYNTPTNFVIEDNKIKFVSTDDYLSVGSFTIITDDTEYTGYGSDDLSTYTIPSTSKNVKLILNGTDTTTENNIFILRPPKEISSNEINITDYTTLYNTLTCDSYENLTINIQSNIILEGSTTLNMAIKTLIINGNDKTIDGQNTYQFLNIPAISNITINNIKITNCRAYNGGAINNNGTLSITNSTLTHNTATNYGGAIYNNNYRFNMTLTENNITHNTATNYGGAIYNYRSNMTLTENNITQNTATKDGGAIYNYNYANMTLTENNITRNNANYGGAIYNYNYANMILTGNNITQNTATNYGGAIYNSYRSNMILTGNNITQNTANQNGGAIYNNNAIINKIENNEFSYNTPANFVIEDNKIKFVSTDNYLSVGSFTIIIDDTEYTGYGSDDLSTCNIPSTSKKVLLILNGTDTTSENNIFLLKSSYEIFATTTDDGKINVTITDENGDPIPNVPVNITDCAGNVIAQGVTDENGNTIIDPEDYKGGLNVITPGKSGNNDTIPVVVMPENPEIHAIARSDGNITVTIEEDDGTPLAYVPVNITDSEGNVIGSGVTDENGNAIIEIGDYTDELHVITPRNNGKTETTNVTILPSPTINTTTEEIVLGESTNLTAEFYTLDGLVVPDGKAFFRVNGKALRNNQGKVIYVDVSDGKTVLENVNITGEWTKPDTTIQAVYFGNEGIDSIFTRKIRVNVTKPEAVINITSKLEATVGQNVTLTANVTSGHAVVNSGRVAFKLNGKTLKDGTGKALYANVINGFATTNYTIPVKTKDNTYKLTAVFTDIKYDRVEVTEDYVIGKT